MWELKCSTPLLHWRISRIVDASDDLRSLDRLSTQRGRQFVAISARTANVRQRCRSSVRRRRRELYPVLFHMHRLPGAASLSRVSKLRAPGNAAGR